MSLTSTTVRAILQRAKLLAQRTVRVILRRSHCTPTNALVHRDVNLVDTRMTCTHRDVNLVDTRMTCTHRHVSLVDAGLTCTYRDVSLVDAGLTCTHRDVRLVDAGAAQQRCGFELDVRLVVRAERRAQALGGGEDEAARVVSAVA